MPGSESRVFVYGTLMRGGSNHPRLTAARFAAVAETAPGWELRHLGRFPAMTRGEGSVRGEVWVVSDAHLAELDAFEEVPTLYVRETVDLACDASAEAWVMDPSKVVGFPRIDGGNWLAIAASPAPTATRPPSI